MQKQKLDYQVPETETLVVQTEGRVLDVVSPNNIKNWEDDGDPIGF